MAYAIPKLLTKLRKNYIYMDIGVHTIPIPTGYSIKEAWEAVKEADIPEGDLDGWENIFVDDDYNEFICRKDGTMIPIDEEDVIFKADTQSIAVARALEDVKRGGDGDVFVSYSNDGNRVFYEIPEHLADELRTSMGTEDLVVAIDRAVMSVYDASDIDDPNWGNGFSGFPNKDWN